MIRCAVKTAPRTTSALGTKDVFVRPAKAGAFSGSQSPPGQKPIEEFLEKRVSLDWGRGGAELSFENVAATEIELLP